MNPTHELVCRFDFLTFLDRFRIFEFFIVFSFCAHFLNLAHFIFSLGFILHLRFNKLSRFSLGPAWVQRGSAWVQMHPLDPFHPLDIEMLKSVTTVKTKF